MSFSVRDGSFDVAILAAPRLTVWPSVGVRVLSAHCADMGLTVGVFGGNSVRVCGVLPLPGTGGIALVEDLQGRVHRIRARAIVRVSLDPGFPDPFEGFDSPAVLSIETASRLLKNVRVSWDPATGILGTGNRALRFGSSLLEAGCKEVFCVESFFAWGGKRIAGWEVERRRFEMAGGKILEVKPLKLTQKSAMLWEFRVGDSLGTRLMEVARVVSAGPFRSSQGYREYPPGSLLFELEQTALATRHEDVESYVLEEERARALAVRISRALSGELSIHRDELEKAQRRSRSRLRWSNKHREMPFLMKYEGKWASKENREQIKTFEGVPKHAQKSRLVASIECIEDIPCDLCEKACPESAIKIERVSKEGKPSFLIESDCTACGICLPACPSATPVMMHEQEERSFSQLVLPWRGKHEWKPGEFAILLNRRGEPLGQGRVVALLPLPEGTEAHGTRLVQLDVPSHLIWEARGLKISPIQEAIDEQARDHAQASEASSWVEISLDGEKRLTREDIPLSTALFEMGLNRPGDGLLCRDGSCKLCQVTVDGIKQLACQTVVRRGIVVKLHEEIDKAPEAKTSPMICRCLGIQVNEVVERMQNGKLNSPEAVLSAIPVGEGKCHGAMCSAQFRRILETQGVATEHWVDWRFPWTDWSILPGSD